MRAKATARHRSVQAGTAAAGLSRLTPWNNRARQFPANPCPGHKLQVFQSQPCPGVSQPCPAARWDMQLIDIPTLRSITEARFAKLSTNAPQCATAVPASGTRCNCERSAMRPHCITAIPYHRCNAASIILCDRRTPLQLDGGEFHIDQFRQPFKAPAHFPRSPHLEAYREGPRS